MDKISREGIADIKALKKGFWDMVRLIRLGSADDLTVVVFGKMTDLRKKW